MIGTLLTALAVLLGSGCAALLARHSPRLATRLGVAGAVFGGLIGLVPAGNALWTASSETLHLPWSVPMGSLALGLDPLSAFFLLPIFILTALAAVYGGEYLKPDFGKRDVGVHWFFYNLLTAGMVGVVLARNGVLFLTAWEVMTVASFFLVVFEHEKASVREAGWTYLVAAHLGTACLLVLFLLLGGASGSLDFGAFRVQGASAQAGWLFLLAVVGFGTKAGFLPLHVWLPEAHPAAPSHVSAVMSAVMIKTGIYGLLRVLGFLGAPPPAWGYALMAIGLASGLFGALFALAQHDFKRLLAYSSVENVGIITLGLGIGVLGVGIENPMLMVLGFGGGLLHVLNHALFKGLLFLGAGAVRHATDTLDLNRLGGLFKRMPVTGACVLAGVVALCGLPPFNGFVVEFLIYLAGFQGGAALPPTVAGILLIAVAGLALIGGLALAAFTKAFGSAFLGEPRTDAAAGAHESGPAMVAPLGILAGACALLGLLGPVAFRLLSPVIAFVARLPRNAVQVEIHAAAQSVWAVTFSVAGLLLLLVAVALFRHYRLARHQRVQSVTWDCGYARPTPRMQYTASSFAQPLVDTFALILRTRRRVQPPQGVFPEQAALETHLPDAVRRYLFEPLFRGSGWLLSRMRWLQHGRVQLYVLYIAAALLALLVWKLR